MITWSVMWLTSSSVVMMPLSASIELSWVVSPVVMETSPDWANPSSDELALSFNLAFISSWDKRKKKKVRDGKWKLEINYFKGIV